MDTAKESAEASALRLAQKLLSEHGVRAIPIATIIAQTEASISAAGLSVKEWQSVIRSLQEGLDDYVAFSSKN